MAIKRYYAHFKNNFYIEGALSFANYTLLNGIFLIGFALALGANNFQLGLLMAIPLFANLLQLFSPYIVETSGTKKYTTLVTLFTGRFIWVFIAAVALGLAKSNDVLSMLMVVVLLSSLLSAIGNLSLLSWMKDIVPVKKLARFWGKRNMYASIGGMSVYFIGAYLIDKYDGISSYGYVFVFSVFIGLCALAYLRPITEEQKKSRLVNPKEFFTKLILPFKNHMFRPLLYFGLFWGFAINIASPFFLVYMVDDLKLSFLIITLFILAETLSRIYGLNIWRKIAEKYGAKPLLIVCATVTSMLPFAFLFITKSNYLLIFPIFMISAMSYAGVDITVGQMLFKSSPKKESTYYLSVFTSLTGLTSAFGPILGGLLAELIKSRAYVPALDMLPPLKYIFIISFLLRVSSIPMIYRLHDPKAR
ncbi:MFS transporter, partial [Candidatus Woesearchaeota archaeon]|nr:MFS transporter [Candidatus Woesearchaeota archaeon]